MTGAERDLGVLLPRGRAGYVPPERACAVMEAELHALACDIAACRAHARHVAAGGLDLRSCPAPATAGLPDVVVRPIEPGDARELARTFGRLSALSRFRRFLAPLERLSHHQLEYLTCVDHVDHEALIALDPKTGTGVGVARYVRDPAQPSRGDFAAVVADAWQGRGVGALLVSRLAEHAAVNGIEVLEGRTVAANRAARRLAHTSLDACAGTLVLTLRIQPQASAAALDAGPPRFLQSRSHGRSHDPDDQQRPTGAEAVAETRSVTAAACDRTRDAAVRVDKGGGARRRDARPAACD